MSIPAQAQPTTNMPRLLVLNGNQRGVFIPLDFESLKLKPLVLGRSTTNADVVLQSPQNLVSSRHAIISYRAEDGLLIISDPGSTNGTFVNGDRVAGNIPLFPGDWISCADVELVFLLPGPVGAPPPKPARYQVEDNSPGMARLEVVASNIPNLPPGSFCRLTPTRSFVIGRNQSNDMRLIEQGDAQRMVSRKQAEIRWSEQGYLIYDPGATNPSLVNGNPLVGSMLLKEGDTIVIASTTLRFRAPRKPFGGKEKPSAAKTDSRMVVLRHASRLPLYLGPERLGLPQLQEIIIGRDKDGLLRLMDVSISRRHARLFYQNGQLMVDDLGSANGTFVNRELVLQPTQLKLGDHLQIGEFEFVVEDSSQPGSQPVPLGAPVTMQLALEQGAVRVAPAPRVTGFISVVPKPLPPPADYKGTFEEICEKLGTIVNKGGNEPFLLDDPDSFWLVKKGKVEVFAVQLSEGKPVNARHHICSVVPGQALIGLDSARYGGGLGLLGVAVPDTHLLKVPAYHLRYMVKEPQLTGNLSQMLEDWIDHLSRSISGESSTSPIEAALEVGAELELIAQQRVGLKKSGLWVKLLEGSALYFGEEELGSDTGETVFPVFGNSWLLVPSKCRLKPIPSQEILTDPRLWEGLDQFHEIFFRIKVTNIRLMTFEEINRLRRKAEYDTAVAQTALGNLSSIFEDRKAGEEPAYRATRNLLLNACRMIGEARGILIQTAREQFDASGRSNPLDDIARASRIRIREVTLEPDWWKQDIGALLGYWNEGVAGKEAGSPLALLPLSSKRYEVVDPADNSRTVITREIAAQISNTAYVFYRPFPLRIFKAWELIRFGTRGSSGDLVNLLLLSIGVGLLALFIPAITGFLFDTVTPTGNRSLLFQVVVGLIVVTLASVAFQFTRGIAILRFETRLELSTQAALWDKLLELPTSFFRKYTVGDLAVRAMGLDVILQLVGGNVITAVLGSVFSIFSFFQLFAYDAGLAFVALGLIALTLLAVIIFSLWELRFQRTLTELQGKVSGLVLQLITGIAKLRVAGAETRAFGVWAREFTKQRRIAYKARTVSNYQQVFNSILPIITSAVIFAAVDSFKKQGTLTTGSFLAFVAAFGQFQAAMITMVAAFTSVLQAIPLYERIRVILDAEPEVQSGKINPGELNGDIELNHVSFRYSPETPYILNDVSLHIRAGQFIAIVGPSGSGKSTIFRLLLGFEKPESGSILFDNQDLSELDLSAVRRRTGVVMQNGKLMPGDILSNIIGSSPFTVEEAWEAARMAGLEDDIKQMPMGMFTLISEGGSTLSGGQRQRLMIARSIIGKPRILLFDEATSALDNQTQAIVSRSLENLQATRIVIAHRLSTIINADCIYVLQGGNIAEFGTFQELMSRDGLFKDLASRQLA
ncbi:MAG: NHLP bacteriocin export ABC transporter permease/ATPase subunit [Chloroflexi bacterium]|uniref:NHLP bacteriocin export ABC transporter permease/ATPase subunit n=1 Tax=Candidatus Chlorohelix allophototropha TaxID=3003348 RepID=A0A8T7M5B3_9CHLR|nr:NHLP bacteriocin export ABC transporter permease/ATPase subunit [Chloroflexota bacterium]WJW69157.1 NHLP bacteriocin export ABC transporter permease/ATPase subunit [Chloroflexota bacterium L227-S17]